MEKFFTISQIAEMVNTTTETLRHYDRIGLLKPCKTDKWTGYRYYSNREIVLLNTINALRCMDLSLNEIKEILQINDFQKITELLKQAEGSADSKIAKLKDAQSKIHRARLFYESKLDGGAQKEIFTKILPRRVILLSQNMSAPSLENLWDYHRHFYRQIGDNIKDEFSFEDLAGIYETAGDSRLFAVCTKYTKVDGLKILPEGKYLCADCTENNKEEVALNMLDAAKNQFAVVPEFSVQIIVLSGILQWNYQLQMLIE